MDKLAACQASKLSNFLAHPFSKQINKKNLLYSSLQLYNSDGHPARPGPTRTNTQSHRSPTPFPYTCACAYINAYTNACTGTHSLYLCIHQYRYRVHPPGEHRPCVH
jgi:hypothetical protein